MEVRMKPIRAPLLYVARDVVETEAVGLELVYRSGAQVAVLKRVVCGEGTLPDVAAPLAVGREMQCSMVRDLWLRRMASLHPFPYAQ